MSRITKTDAFGLMEAYNSIYTLSEEQIEIEELGISIVENAANVLFSQGYTVNDLCDYFAEASVETISEDYFSFAEGQTYISENFIAADEYIQEQFNILEDILDEASQTRLQKIADKKNKILTGPTGSKPHSTTNAAIKKYGGITRSNISGGIPSTIKQNRPSNSRVTTSSPKVTPPSNSRVTTNYSVPASQMGPKLPPKPGLLQKAGNWAKNLMGKAKDVVKKIPGAGVATKIAKSPVGKFARKVGSRVLPGVGVVAYGADAANRFKKGDWGGGLLSTAGAVTSAIPGANLVAGLAPAGIQMATDAMGLTGDKSRKGTTPAGVPKSSPTPSLKAKQDYASSKGKYYSSSDKKTYANYNDALAARNSRRGTPGVAPGKTPTAPSARASSSSTPSSSALAKPSPAPVKPSPAPVKPSPAPVKPSPAPAKPDYESWAKKNPTLAAKVKPGQSGYEDIQKLDLPQLNKPRPEQKQDQTPTQGPSTAKIDTKDADNALKAEVERQKRRLEQQNKTPVTTKESYEPYDVVLNYLLSEGHADTLDEANYIMLEMDEKAIGIIMEEYEDYLLAEEIQEWVNGLVEEGYDLSQYTWDDMIEYYVNEAKEDEELTPLQKIRKRNKAYAIPGEPAGQQTSNRRAERSSQRGVKKQKGEKSAFGTMRHVGGPYK